MRVVIWGKFIPLNTTKRKRGKLKIEDWKLGNWRKNKRMSPKKSIIEKMDMTKRCFMNKIKQTKTWK